MVRIRFLSAYRTFVFALLLALSFSSKVSSVDAVTTNEHTDDEHTDDEDGKVKVSTKINLHLHNTYSKMEELDQESTFKQLIEQCFDNELPRIEALATSSSSSLSPSTSKDYYKLSHVRVRILEQFWGEEYKIESTSSSSSNERRLQEAAKLQPLIVRLIVTGRYAERGPTFQLDDHKKLPSSAGFYATIKSFFDGGGGDILVGEYIPAIQETLSGNVAAYLMEIEEIELLEQNGIVIKDEANKRNEVDGKVSRPGLIAGCVLLGIATICVLVMFVIRLRRRHRFINGEFILTRCPSQPGAVYLPSEIDLESVGGSIVSGMYYSSAGVNVLAKSEKGAKESSNMLPPRSSEEDTDRDGSFTIGDDSSDEAQSRTGNHHSSFLQFQPDGNITATEENCSEVVDYKDFSNTDIEAQAKARLMRYLEKYSDKASEFDLEREGKESVEAKSTIDEASRASGDGCASVASFASQEASLLKKLGVVRAPAGKVEDEGKHEGSKGAESASSGTSESDGIDITSCETSLLRNLGVSPLLLPNEPEDEENSLQSNPLMTNDDNVVQEEEISYETENNIDDEDMGNDTNVDEKSMLSVTGGGEEASRGNGQVASLEGNELDGDAKSQPDTCSKGESVEEEQTIAAAPHSYKEDSE